MPMTTPFLVAFAEALVSLLRRSGLAEIREGAEPRVVVFVAEWLATEAQGGSLLSNLERALLACPDVDELYATVDDLKILVDGLAA
jgi:hypothetical protein